MRDFATRTYGKWILAGEHAVLRGCPALAFPLMSRSLHLVYKAAKTNLHVEFHGDFGEELKLLFYGVLENAVERLQIPEPLTGTFTIENSLPLGAGLGASAALCGAVARWCEAQGWIGETEVYEFGCRLEDLFHGESSGVDLAVSLSAQGMRFLRGGPRTPLKLNWWPRFCLSYTGQRGMTGQCVKKVKRLFETHPADAVKLDQRMREAVEFAELALQKSETDGMLDLQRAIDLSCSCFEEWDLCGGDVGDHLNELRAAGATAVKPTGSGDGGYVLSLWKNLPPENLLSLFTVPRPGQAASFTSDGPT